MLLPSYCEKCCRPLGECVCSPLAESEVAALRKRVSDLACHHGEAGDNCGFNENEDYACWACYSLVKAQRDVLRKRVEELDLECPEGDSFAQVLARAEKAEFDLYRAIPIFEEALTLARERVEKAERERDSYRRDFDAAAHACDKLQADLDAALMVLESVCPSQKWANFNADPSGRVLALLAEREARHGK